MIFDLYHKHVHQHKHIRYGLYAAIVAGVLALTFVSYRWYTHRHNEQAQIAFATVIDLYDKARRENVVHVWTELQQMCEREYKKYGSTELGPYFLAFQADAALSKGDVPAALTFMDRVLEAVPHKSPLYGFYAIKRALIKCDSSDKTIKAAGEQELQALSTDPGNKTRSMALYYRGLRAFDAGLRAEAVAIWKDLATLAGGDATDSVWATHAKEKLAFVA